MNTTMASLAALALLTAAPAFAKDGGSCPSEADRAELRGFSARLASAGTTEEARELALAKIRLGQKAIDRAEKLRVADATGLAEAEARLDALEAGVRAAETPDAVAAQFDRLDANAVKCDYTPTEIIIIVVGFVLGIIPGIIFLFLFC